MMRTRLLYVDVNASFINPTRNLLPLAMMQAAEVCFFGPGHVSSECLAKGLPAFIDQYGPFDVVASNTLVLFADRVDPARYASTLRSAYAYDGSPEDLLYLPIIARHFAASPLPRLVILLENDFYNWTAKERDKVDSAGDVFIGYGVEFSPLMAAMPHKKNEKFAAITTDIWAEFCRREKHRVASMPHFVCDAEYDLTPLALRRFDWSVMGVQYHARGVARDHLVANGLDPITDSKLRKFVSLLKKTRLMRGEKRRVQKALNADFAQRIASTRFSFTCGSGLKMPIRKFFEIPAAGALLVCRPFEGFSAAGFIDGVNCVIAEPDQLFEVHQAMSADLETAQRIARAGQQWVMDRHSLNARSADLADILKAISEGLFCGSHWYQGVHRLRGDATRRAEA
jgi:hypothetical protein